LRTSRDSYLQHFGKIGTGDIVQLLKEIEQEVEAKEKAQKGELTVVADEQGTSPLVVAASLKTEGEDEKDGKGAGEDVGEGVKDSTTPSGADEDVKMDK
jgi:THO complex subunit 1